MEDRDADLNIHNADGRFISFLPSFGSSELKTADIYRATIAEFFATLFFVGFSIAGIVASQKQLPNASLVWLTIVGFHVILILIIIFAFANLSGAHFNPAVTVALFCVRRVTFIRALFYVIAQLIGAITGAGLVKIILPFNIATSLAVPGPLNGASDAQAMGAEFFGTFGLVFGLFGLAFDPRGWGTLAPVGVALIIGINVHAMSFVSGSVFNPARALGPAVVEGVFTSQWSYWVGPMLGGICASILYEYLFITRKNAHSMMPSSAGNNHPKEQ